MDGNITADPLFVDPSNGDFRLSAGSPCIDAGDPLIADADGTRSDMGATGGGFVAYVPQIDVDDVVGVNMSAPSPLNIRNTGHADLIVSSLMLPSAFATEIAFPQTVLPGDTLSVPITYTPSGADNDSVAIVVHNDEYQPPREVILIGVAGTPLYGNVSGVLLAEHSPYRVVNQTAVPEGSALTIEAGVDVLFDADVQFIVQGAIHAHGTETDSVRFLKGTANMWGSIRISGGGSSSFTYTRISDGNVERSSSQVRGGGLSISGSGTRVQMTHCTISGNAATEGGGLANFAGAITTLTHCTISGNTAYYYAYGGGLFNVYATLTLTNCTISGNTAAAGGGLHNHESATATLTNCIISGNTASDGGGLYNYGSASSGSATATLTNCTVYGNNATAGSGVFNGAYATATLKNCILWENTSGKQIELSSGTVTVWYSNIQGDVNGGVTPGITYRFGVITTDPLFVNAAAGDFHLSPISPCINAGDPGSPLDPDGTRADMGAIPYERRVDVTSPTPVSFTLVQNAPNPFNPTTTIRFGLPESGTVSLTIYDVNGRLVQTLVDDYRTAGIHEVVWDARDDAGRAVASGVYVYRLTARGNAAVRRMVLVR